MYKRRELLQYLAVAAVPTLPRFALAQVPQTAHLVFIHGRGQGAENPAQLCAGWKNSLSKGLLRQGRALPLKLNIAFPFYGSLLDNFVAQWVSAKMSDVQTKGYSSNESFLALQADIANSLKVNAGITDAEVDRAYGNNPKPKGAQNWEWVLATIRAIDHANVGLTEKAIENFTRDVFLYLNRTEVQKSINKTIIDELTDEPTVIVAHSLGSVVAYNVLCTVTRKLNVPLLVTIGSPLGIQAIKKNFSPLRFPDSVGAWYNAFDKKDVVALRPLDSKNFPVEPKIENNSSIKNWTDNHHSAVGYLDDKNVCLKIVSALKQADK